MAKNFVSVPVAAQLGAIPVSEYDDGAIGFATDTALHYTLLHNYVGVPVSGRVLPLAGSPIAGSPNAVWNPAV